MVAGNTLCWPLISGSPTLDQARLTYEGTAHRNDVGFASVDYSLGHLEAANAADQGYRHQDPSLQGQGTLLKVWFLSPWSTFFADGPPEEISANPGTHFDSIHACLDHSLGGSYPIGQRGSPCFIIHDAQLDQKGKVMACLKPHLLDHFDVEATPIFQTTTPYISPLVGQW